MTHACRPAREDGLLRLKNFVPRAGGAYAKSATAQMNSVLENLIDSSKNKQAAQELFNWVNGHAPKASAVHNPPLP